MSKIRVMIVEDSPTMRAYLEHIIGADPRLTVAGTFGTAEEAIANLNRLSPDVISLDIRLPGMNGLEATLKIMSEKPTPIVVFAAEVDTDSLNISMNALRAGALMVVEKPSGSFDQLSTTLAHKICDQLVSMSVVKLVRQRSQRSLQPAAVGARPVVAKPPRPITHLPGHSGTKPFRMLGLVASTGGPNALVQVLSKLPAAYPLPILLVQHITPSFLTSFVSWLAGLCPFQVLIANDGDLPLPGRVYLPPVDRHLEINAGRLTLSRAEEVCAQRPSGTVLFNSMARTLGAGALGVLMTGMGEDGAKGLLAIREAGGYTIAEHESSCVVYGMPAAAVRLAAAVESRPIEEMSARLVELVEGA